MAEAVTRAPSHAQTRDTSSPWAMGASVFAGSLMVLVGILGFFQGLIALVSGNDFLLRTPNYLFRFDASTWGWVHLILGVALAAVGAFIFTGSRVARILGIFLAGVAAVANFLWLPYYPFWALVLLALDVFVIWGLATSNLAED
ncbi:MAG TPA: hypothetical protein VKB14_08245 [Actinomycetales bacterium]|nr:hypothetical protein [Actinomycetales bacterium]